MHPDHVAALARMHAEKMEEQARLADLLVGLKPEPLWRQLRRRRQPAGPPQPRPSAADRLSDPAAP